jgi:hypothetical protein
LTAGKQIPPLLWIKQELERVTSRRHRQRAHLKLE